MGHRADARMSFALDKLREAVARHGVVARVVVVDTKGSVPREAGTSMLVWNTGQSGTIGGGALEFEAAEAARGAMQAGQSWITRQALGPRLNQCCGGAVTLVTEVFDQASLPETTDTSFVRPVGKQSASEMPLAFRAALRRARGEGLEPPVKLSDGWLLEPISRPTRELWIFGAGHVGRALIAVLAPLPEFAITWVDTGPDRFPSDIPDGVSILPAADPALALRHAPEHAEVLILTYSHELDLALCHAVLQTDTARAGLIGSATKWARFRSRLAQMGHSPNDIDRITCPIGDPALGKHPQAIAVSVAADLLRAPHRHAVKERGQTG